MTQKTDIPHITISSDGKGNFKATGSGVYKVPEPSGNRLPFYRFGMTHDGLNTKITHVPSETDGPCPELQFHQGMIWIKLKDKKKEVDITSKWTLHFNIKYPALQRRRSHVKAGTDNQG